MCEPFLERLGLSGVFGFWNVRDGRSALYPPPVSFTYYPIELAGNCANNEWPRDPFTVEFAMRALGHKSAKRTEITGIQEGGSFLLQT